MNTKKEAKNSRSEPVNPPFGWDHQTVGFIFSHDFEQVLLIRKKRPNWQKGKLNGIGGHLNKKERAGFNFHDTFIRKAKEEAGLDLDNKKLKDIAVIQAVHEATSVMVYAYRLDKEQVPKQQTDEMIIWIKVSRLPVDGVCVLDILFLIPYARHVLKHVRILNMAALSISYK